MREYEQCEEREYLILSNWRKMIKEEDIVIHLGDHVFGGTEKLEKLTRSLPGRKILVLGNHDSKPPLYYMQRGFDFACYEFKWRKYIFTHKPKEDIGDKINIHGHFHTLNSNQLEEYTWYNTTNYRLVSMKSKKYKPIKL